MGNFKALRIYLLTAGKGSSRQVHEGMYLGPNGAFTSEVTPVCSKAHVHVFFRPPIQGNTITQSTQFVRYQVLVSGYQIPATRDSVQQAVWVAERLIYLPEKTQQGSSVQPTHPCAVSRGCWNWVVGKNIKTHLYELRVSVLPLNTSSGWSNDCQSFRAESSMALFIIIAPRWASVGYCKISTKPGTGSGKDKKISLLFSSS